MNYEKQLAALRDKIARNDGKRDSLLETLRTDYECESLEEAKALLKKLEAEHKQAEAEYERRKQEFDDTYGDKLKALTS